MSIDLSIGDFSRMTQLPVKTLRHYHEVGLLVPDRIDSSSGYRYYNLDQVATAQVVRRLRQLDMPIADVRAVMAGAPAERNALISDHLRRLEDRLSATQSAVESLRAILEPPEETVSIEYRTVPAVPAAAITATVDRDDLPAWWQGAVGELRATVLADTGLVTTGVPAALFGFEIFTADRGAATVFIPVDGQVRPVGRVEPHIIPAAELATISHRGPHDDVDVAYSALGEYATRREISVEGPLREYYEKFDWDTDDSAQWRTTLCWPVFRADA
ncbi:MerR family transcriptional regulator [Mycolicibacterium neworleansense]|uniref:MerR family transcriptional regulator n=1 Tax=Mycolicibacterium neworleansense TaxID=146018 RepID=A0A0H5S6Z2_9MYCO|nr:MerR family transcriptional regulator [Mycolicibacterium neworleansense]MCV7361633.1 MerR family transcriptional regulator [Mycolicibacterium neworleansense]CRZ16989.1 MerR family transcriptional regulator [Mycolicibacterium neworleansense]